MKYLDKILSDRSEWLMCLALAFAFLMPLSQFLCVRLILISLLVSFFVKNRPLANSIFENAWDISIYISFLLIGLIYSKDLELGWSVIETNFSFLAIPFVLGRIEDFDKVKQYRLLCAFVLGLLAASVLSLSYATLEYINTGDIHAFFFYPLLQFLDYHPTYFGYYIIAALSFGLYLLFFEEGKFNPTIVLTIISFLFLMLMLTGGITSFVSILLVLSFFIFKYLTEQRTKVRSVTFCFVLMMSIGLFAFSFIYKKMDSQQVRVTDYWERLSLWESAVKANPNIFLGVGTGDYKEELNKFYRGHNMNDFAESSYNSHNQFIQILFSNGILGLIGLLLLLGRPLIMSIKYQNILGSLIFFPFLIFGLTEVFLNRFQGVVFFAFMHQLFINFYKANHLTER